MIRCCNCDKLYDLKFYEGNLIACPHCGYQHKVYFKPIDDEKKEPLVPIEEVRLSAAKPVMIASRLCTGARGNLGTGADNEDITGYVKANSFIVVAQIDEERGTYTSTYTLYWRDVTDAGAMAPLAATGECKIIDDTSLVNGTDILIAGKLCAATGASGSSWQNGEEVSGTATSPSFGFLDEYYTELHYAVSCADGQDGHQYEFQLYENTGGSLLAVALAAAITLEVPAVTYFIPIIMTEGLPVA